MNNKITSRDFFKEKLTEFGADLVNIYKIPRGADELKHYYEGHPVRSDFTDIKWYDENTVYDGKLLTVVSTTFGKKIGDKLRFYAFLGLDVEYPVGIETKNFIVDSLKYFGKTGYIFRTPHSYHLFVLDLFENDMELIKGRIQYILYSAKKLQHSLVTKYCDEYLNARNFDDLVMSSKKILDEVKHIEEKEYMFYDLRHIARSIYSNERNKGVRDTGVEIHENGVRTQSFFCVTKRDDDEIIPYLEATVAG